MDFNEIIGTALPIVYVVVGIVLVWLIVELVLTVRRTRRPGPPARPPSSRF